MRLSISFLLLLAAASTEAFMVPAPPSFVKTQLFTAETHISKDFEADSGMNVNNLPVLIKNLAPDNFEESMEIIEVLLVNECVGKEYDDFLGQLKKKATEIGKEVPAGFAPTHH